MAKATQPDVKIIRCGVSPEAVDAVLGLLYAEIGASGLDPATMAEWSRTTWFPKLRTAPEIEALLTEVDALPGVDGPGRDGGVWCEPQILLRFPNRKPLGVFSPHVDEPPPWAEGRVYTTIVGVALTDCRCFDGCLHIYRGGVPVAVPMRARDVVVLRPDTPHAGSYNVGNGMRGIVYFRALGPRPQR